jgi:hypothetical protein
MSFVFELLRELEEEEVTTESYTILDFVIY